MLRRVMPLVIIAALAVLTVSSCASNSKYGCPNKLEAGLR